LTSDILDQSKICRHVSTSLYLNETELFANDLLSDVGVVHQSEVHYRLELYHARSVRVHFNGRKGNQFRTERDITLTIGTGNVFREIERQIWEWITDHNDASWIRWIPTDTPFFFVLHSNTWHEIAAVPLDTRCRTKLTHFLDYQLPKGHVGSFMERAVIIRDEDLIAQLQNDSITRIVEDTENTHRALIHRKAPAVLLSQMCSPLKSSVRVWTQRQGSFLTYPTFMDTIFVEMDIPAAFDVVFKPPHKKPSSWFTSFS